MSVDTRTLNDTLSDYYEKRAGRYSLSTWRAHEGQLERFRTWVTRDTQPNVYLSDIDDRLMVRYFNRLRPPAHAESTFNNYRQYLSSFFTFCRDEGFITTNPMRHVDALRVPRMIRLQLSADELLRGLEGASPRDRVMLAVGMNTGLRGGDIAALRIGAVNLGNDSLLAWEEKTDQESLLPVTADLRVELLRWFPVYAEAMGLQSMADLPNTWTLCPPAQGRAIDVNDPAKGYRTQYRPHRRYRHPEQVVQRMLTRLGHPTAKEGFHTLRRSAAREIYELACERGVGDPIRIAQALLGHKSVKTTEIYLGISHEKKLRDDLMRGQPFLSARVKPDESVESIERFRSA